MTQANPLISVIVPCYNRAGLIAKTIHSLQQQNYDRYEIIVVDDGSTDNTEEVVKSIATERTTYIKKSNAERAAARNFGANLARGEYINFFDSDDLSLNNHLSEASAMIKERRQPEWFHLGFAWADIEEKIFREVNSFSAPFLNKLLSGGNQLSCNGVFIRKDIILQHPFNEDRDLAASEDYELWLRLAARYPLHYSNTITSWVIDHEGRSVKKINGKALIRRLELLIHHLMQDKDVIQYFGSDFKKIQMDAHSYIALHLAEQPAFKLKSLQYLLMAFSDTPELIITKRFYATIKNILIKW